VTPEDVDGAIESSRLFVKRCFSLPVSKRDGHVLRRIAMQPSPVAEYDDAGAGKLIEKAQAGDPDADAVLCLIGGTLLSEGKELPPLLRTYISLLLAKRAIAPSKKRGKGRHREDRIVFRDLVICAAVDRFVEMDVRPTRHRLARPNAPESACSIVKEALELAGKHLTESRVEDIWRRHNKGRLSK
jgi:hypothetical protein